MQTSTNITNQFGYFIGVVTANADGTFAAAIMRNCARTMTQSIQQIAVCDTYATAEMVVRGELAPASFGVTTAAIVEPAPAAQPAPVAVVEPAPAAQTVIGDIALETVQGTTIVARKGYTLTQPAESKFFKLTSTYGTILSECEGEKYDYCWLTPAAAAAILAQPANRAYAIIKNSFAEACFDAGLSVEQIAEADDCFYEPQLADAVFSDVEARALRKAAIKAAAAHIESLRSRQESPADFAPPREASLYNA